YVHVPPSHSESCHMPVNLYYHLHTHIRHCHGTHDHPCPCHDLPEIGTSDHQALDERKDRFRVALRHESQQLAVHVVRDQPEHFTHSGGRYRPLAERHHLVEDREPVPHAAVRALGDQVQRLIVRSEPFGGGH